MGRSGPLESGFKPAPLNNVFNPAICTSSSVSLICSSRFIFYLALMLNSAASIMDRSDARPLYLSCQVNRKHLPLWSGTTRTLVGCECPTTFSYFPSCSDSVSVTRCSYAPIIKSRVMNIVFRRVYSSPPIASNAEIAILYALFALGAEFGPAITAPSAHGRNYFELSMNALHLDDVYAEPTIETVEALALQAKWHFATNQDQAGANRSFSFVGFTMRIAITVSLVSLPLHVSLILICRADRTS